VRDTRLPRCTTNRRLRDVFRVECEKKGLVDFAFSGAGLGGYNGGSYDHSDKCKGDQDIMHGVILLLRGSSELLLTLIIGPVRFFLNSTKRVLVIKMVLPVFHLSVTLTRDVIEALLADADPALLAPPFHQHPEEVAQLNAPGATKCRYKEFIPHT
jgi:hypothetical protein